MAGRYWPPSPSSGKRQRVHTQKALAIDARAFWFLAGKFPGIRVSSAARSGCCRDSQIAWVIVPDRIIAADLFIEPITLEMKLYRLHESANADIETTRTVLWCDRPNEIKLAFIEENRGSGVITRLLINDQDQAVSGIGAETASLTDKYISLWSKL